MCDLWGWISLQYTLYGNCVALCGFYPSKIVKVPKHLHNFQWSANVCPHKQPHSFTQMLQEAVVWVDKYCHVPLGEKTCPRSWYTTWPWNPWAEPSRSWLYVKHTENGHGSKPIVLILIHRKIVSWLISILVPKLQLWWLCWMVGRHKMHVLLPSVQET